MRRAGTRSGCRGVVFASCLVVLTAAPAAAEWHRVDSPNFVIVGEASPGALGEIAVRFEAFREALARLLSDQATATAVPTVVVVFPSDRAFTPFKPVYRGRPIALSGLFVPGPDVNYIAIVNDGAGFRIVFHEYAHLVIANVARRMPAWLNEGLAEYYSTFEAGQGGAQATIGRPIGDHLDMLRKGPRFRLEALLRIEHDSPVYHDGNRRSTFYAQSWALTHLILHGEPRRTHRLHAYLSRLWQGASSLEAWRLAFGGEEMDRELAQYLERRVFKGHRFTFPEKLAAVATTAVPLGAGDVEAFLADLLLQQQRNDEAADRLAASPDGGSSTPWASTVAALLELERKDLANAERRLLAIDDRADWLTMYRAGVGLSRLVAEHGRPPADRHVAAAERLFTAACAAHGEMPHAVASLARMELAQAGPPRLELRSALERAARAAPGRHDYVLLQARILARQSAFESARLLLAPLMSPAYPRYVRDSARLVMGEIVQRSAAPLEVHTCCSPVRLAHRSIRDAHDTAGSTSRTSFLLPRGQRTLCQR